MTNQEHEIVANHVFLNMSYWMEDVLNNPDHDYYEDAINLTYKVDYESALDDTDWELEQTEDGLFFIIDRSLKDTIRIFDWEAEAIDEFPRENQESLPYDEHELCSDDLKEAIKLCLDQDGIEPKGIESLEYWAVSCFLAEKLKKEGEPVEEINGTLIWGRQTSGQAIAMDGVISRIASS